MTKRKNDGTQIATLKMLTRESFLTFRIEPLDLPEMGGRVFVRELGGKSLLKFKDALEQEEKKNPTLDVFQSLDLMGLLVSMTACNEQGILLFTEDDAALIAEKNPFALQRLAEKALDVSGFPTGDEKNNPKNAQPNSSTT